MSMEVFDFVLPEARIAQKPLEDRSASKLLHLPLFGGEIADLIFRDLPQLLKPGDLLIFNDTRVSARRLMGKKSSGGKVEALVLGPGAEAGTYRAMLKPGRTLKPGSVVEFDEGKMAEVLDEPGDAERLIRFEVPVDMERFGTIPLPPYIRQPIPNENRYQTVFAVGSGSAAAPTAGLHLTEDLIARLKAMGVAIAHVRLDVGLDTFRPIQSETLDEHIMHGERCSIPPETADAIRSCSGRVIAVGTTTTRTLESFANGKRSVGVGEMDTNIFIRPGYKFQIIDGLITNFHMPRTTMLLMVAALCGPDRLEAAYRHALASDYRFLSFGDAMIVL